MSKRFSTPTVVVEFGAREACAVIDSIRSLLGPVPIKIEILRSGHDSDLNYIESDLDLERATSALARGALASLFVAPADESAGFHAMIFCPNFHGDEAAWWSGVVELETGYEAGLVQRVRCISGLDFVAISIEDSLDLPKGERITEDVFPWEDWRLIEAVVANGGELSSKEIRTGPAAKKIFSNE